MKYKKDKKVSETRGTVRHTEEKYALHRLPLEGLDGWPVRREGKEPRDRRQQVSANINSDNNCK